jgi:hypothetical protein
LLQECNDVSLRDLRDRFGVFVHRFAGSPKPKACLTADQTTLSVEAERIFTGDGLELRFLLDPAQFTLPLTGKGLEQLLAEENQALGSLILPVIACSKRQ